MRLGRRSSGHSQELMGTGAAAGRPSLRPSSRAPSGLATQLPTVRLLSWSIFTRVKARVLPHRRSWFPFVVLVGRWGRDAGAPPCGWAPVFVSVNSVLVFKGSLFYLLVWLVSLSTKADVFVTDGKFGVFSWPISIIVQLRIYPRSDVYCF